MKERVGRRVVDHAAQRGRRRPAFREEWCRKNEPSLIRMDGVAYDVGVNRLVREWERGAGRTVRSYVLEVCSARSLGTHHREVYLDRLVLGEAYLEPRNAPLPRSALKAQTSRLA